MSAMFRPPIATAKTIRWREVFGFVPRGERFWSRVRGQQLAVLERYAPVNAVLMLANVVAIAALLRGAGEPLFLAGWGVVMTTQCGLALIRWRRGRRLPEIREASLCEFWLINVETAIFGLAWGALMLRFLPLLPIEDEMVMVLLSATAMGACGFTTAVLPVCAAVLTLSIAGGTLFGLPSWSPLATPMVWLAFATFAVLLLRGTLVTSFAMMARLRTQAENAEAAATIGLLLGEFEAHGSDWLIEVDAAGRLTHVSPRLCEVSGRPHSALLGAPLIGLIGPDRRDPAVRGAVRVLARHFERCAAFRDLAVPVAVRGETRWWSLTGTPKLDGAGRFAGYRGVGSDITEARRAGDRIAELARFDPLTGLANRTRVRETLAASLAGDGCALLFVDLDRFKLVNDSLGHLAGDLLLREVAARLRAVAGPHAELGRLGGDEFAVVLTPGAPHRAERIAKAVVAALARPFMIEGTSVAVGASVGYALGPGDGATVDALLRAADLALYEVKGGGRGAACRFVPEIARRAEERRAPRSRSRARPRPGRTVARLPADRRCPRRGDRRLRGAAAVDASDARQHPADPVHPRRRGDRADRPHRRVGHRAGVRLGRAVARAYRHRGQFVGAAV